MFCFRFKSLILMFLSVALSSSQAAWGMWNGVGNGAVTFNAESVRIAQQLDAAIRQLNISAGGNLNAVLQQMRQLAEAQERQANAQAEVARAGAAQAERLERARAEAANAPDRIRAETERDHQRAEDRRQDLEQQRLNEEARIARMAREAEERLRIQAAHAEQEARLEIDRRERLQAQSLAHREAEAKLVQKIELDGMEQKMAAIMKALPNLGHDLPGMMDAFGGHMEAAQVASAKEQAQAAIAMNDKKWSSIKEIFQSVGDGIKDFTGDPKRMAILASVVIAVIFAYYGAPIMWHYLESLLKKPRIVSETSRMLWGSKPISTAIEDTIVDIETQKQLIGIVDRITLARENGENLFNVLFYGAPGTGKTMFARALAHHSGLDYAIMSGSEFTKITDTNIAITELQKLVRWAERSPKGLIIFIDEAESFLAERSLPTTTKWSQDMLNAFLAAVPKPTSKKMMFIFATNHPFKLDKAVLSRVGERIEFKLPAQSERERILMMYLNKFGQEKSVVLSQDLIGGFSSIAHQLEGIAPREIEYIAEKMTQIARQSGDKVNVDGQEDKFELSMEIAQYVTDLMKKSIKESHKWDAERQHYVDQMVAASH